MSFSVRRTDRVELGVTRRAEARGEREFGAEDGGVGVKCRG